MTMQFNSHSIPFPYKNIIPCSFKTHILFVLNNYSWFSVIPDPQNLPGTPKSVVAGGGGRGHITVTRVSSGSTACSVFEFLNSYVVRRKLKSNFLFVYN